MALALEACGDPAPREADTSDRFIERARPAPAAAPTMALGRIVSPDRTPASAAPSIVQDSASRMLIRRGSVVVRVDSLEPAMEAVRALAASLGGHVGNVSVMAGEYEIRSATLQLRVPVARFDSALAGLTPIGRVEASHVSAEDVGEEYADIGARMANSRRLEDRLVTLLRTQTGKLEDVLAVERELARVRQEIESTEARMRYLRTNVALSTIDVTVSERAPLVGQNPGRNVLVQSLINAWRNTLRFVAFGIESLGFILPLVAIVLAWRQISRRRRARGDTRSDG
jgi:acetolactate synthase small subunit